MIPHGAVLRSHSHAFKGPMSVEVVDIGEGVDPARIGERVITDGWLRDINDPDNINKVGCFGSERNGGFAEYATIPASNAFSIG